uniref:Uncharacterized protein n=1 Tax=Periophthalmus magnuspinnatus TaxID=409849 RepID=A0A3B4BA46_9GOBI
LLHHGCAESHKPTAKENEKPFLALSGHGPILCSIILLFFFFQALKEIARVSEELCSYQEEIRQKNTFTEREIPVLFNNPRSDVVEPCDLSEIYDELRALEREHWITLSPENTWQSPPGPGASWKTSPSSPDNHREPLISPETLSEIDSAAPPIPPRSSSWNLSSQQDADLNMPESPMVTARKCHSPCVVVDRKCTSPSIVRKFEAMLQENEGKVLIDGTVSSCSVPANQNCNVSCCHNRWSCDASKLTNKVSSYGTVQKSFSEVNIVTAAKKMGTDYGLTGANVKSQEVHPKPATLIETPMLICPPEISLASRVLQGSRRNITLEQKTAEFNRCLFQAEMGRGVEEQDTFSPPDLTPALCQQSRTTASSEPSAENKQRPTEGQQVQPKHVSAPSDCYRPGLRMMNEHPWKPLTLAAYPRPEGSRSNYGAVERILKNYETAAKSMNQKETGSSPNLSVREKSERELDMLDMDSQTEAGQSLYYNLGIWGIPLL